MMNERQKLLRRLNQNPESIVERLRRININVINRTSVSRWTRGERIPLWHKEILEEFLREYEWTLMARRDRMLSKNAYTISTENASILSTVVI